MIATFPAVSASPPVHETESRTKPHGAEKSHSGNQDYIDAVRGWAILLVITSHVGGSFTELPYPIKKLTNFGWNGVQMFFIASAVTLLMSWNRQKSTGLPSIRSFFLRRFLRIFPMYYSGAVIYYLCEPPLSGFDALQLVRSFMFVNAWHPDWIPTTPGWTVVPGGWSIGVEFTFYAIFPLVAALVTSLSRAAIFFIVALLIAGACNSWGSIWLAGYDEIAASKFLYYWFPNQAPVFALGVITYFLVSDSSVRIRRRTTAYVLVLAVVAMCVIVAERQGAPAIFGRRGIPIMLLATAAFMAFFFVLSKSPDTLFAHPWIRRMGVLSFSAYVLHFLFVDKIPTWTGGIIDISATGYTAIAMAGMLWVATVVCTFAAASLANAWIEQPGINLARRLTSSR